MEHTLFNCPFCRPRNALFSNELGYVIADSSPVNPGHLLIIPKRHVAGFFDITDDERSALFSLLTEAKHFIDVKHAPDGFNVGVNIGEVAGQTVMHVHLHLIPRYRGDTPHPRGGVRGVIPSRQSY